MRCRLPWLLLLIVGCDVDGPPYAVGTVERDRIELTTESGEPIIAIDVREGDRVEVGQVLVRQDGARLDAQREQAVAIRDQAAASLQEAIAGPRSQDIERAEARLAAAVSVVDTARHELDRERGLVEQRFTSPNRLDLLEGRYQEALAHRREAAASLDELREGTRQEVLLGARKALAGAEARIRELEIAQARLSVTAPLAASVEALPFEIGERPVPGQHVVVLRALSPAYARVYLPEALRTRLHVGSPAELHVDGHAAAYRGRLRWIAAEAAFTPYFALTQRDRGRLAYAAEVLIEDGAALPAGVPVEVYFPGVDE